MNAGGGKSRTPVENMFSNAKTMPDGKYVFNVNQFARRESSDPGFELEVQLGDKVYHFFYSLVMHQNATVQCFVIVVKNGVPSITDVHKDLVCNEISKEVWGIKTGDFQKVKAVCKSPNYWDDRKVGTEHVFFMIDGCEREGDARGLYNEFLHGDLQKHKKVFEVLGSKMKCKPTSEQFSGIGFSKTKRSSLKMRVKTKTSSKLFNVQF